MNQQSRRLTNWASKAKWKCQYCSKKLCSKRSYDEHLNVHKHSRPFECKHCAYAAASQMTLRRHTLRNHLPRDVWGYQCPYCIETYMEPASYQQHIASRHVGRSATLGCTSWGCVFTTLSSAHLRDHLSKHNTLSLSTIDDVKAKLHCFTVDDRLGKGYEGRLYDVAHTVIMSRMEKASCRNLLETGPQDIKVRLIRKRIVTSIPPRESASSKKHINSSKPPLKNDELAYFDDIDCSEEVIDDSAHCLHEGMIEPELD